MLFDAADYSARNSQSPLTKTAKQLKNNQRDYDPQRTFIDRKEYMLLCFLVLHKNLPKAILISDLQGSSIVIQIRGQNQIVIDRSGYNISIRRTLHIFHHSTSCSPNFVELTPILGM
jgi:hypothetical protein